MHWIDFSGLKFKGLDLPEAWTFENAKSALPAEHIAEKGEKLLLSMRINTLGDGEICFVSDHLNLSGKNPLRGANKDAYGVRFPDMSKPYDFPAEENTLLIRAGQHKRYPADLIKADPIVFQNILAKHQTRKVWAILYGPKTSTDAILKKIQGVKYA